MFSETGIEGADQETKDVLTKLEWRIVAGLCVIGLGMLIWGMVWK